MWRLQRALAEISGLPHVSLQPSAGSHGEQAGLLLTRAFHEERGQERHKVLTPDTAHGTNPATVTMSGYEVVKVGTAPDGGVDLDDLREKATEDVACLMLTNPNTLGLFDRNIREIAAIVHEVGGTLYYDGANLNAVMGISRPGDMGFDIVHFNLHKTFTQPHGGGGPGSGPIAVSDRIEPFLPRPQVVRREGSNGSSGDWFDLDYDRPKSIGRLRGFHGNFGVFVRSYAYICSLGADGLKEASETAVLNANYLKALLGREGIAEYLPLAFDRHCMHEFVLSGRGAKEKLGIKTLDIAKRLLDHEVHPPTVYFPLLVDEALMIEPTETEPKERLDQFADAIRSILEEAKEDPEVARNAPYTTPVRRLDEAAAAKRPVVTPALKPFPVSSAGAFQSCGAERAGSFVLRGSRAVSRGCFPVLCGIGGTEEEAAVEAVRDVLRSKRLFRYGGVTANPFESSRVRRLERSFARTVGSRSRPGRQLGDERARLPPSREWVWVPAMR